LTEKETVKNGNSGCDLEMTLDLARIRYLKNCEGRCGSPSW